MPTPWIAALLLTPEAVTAQPATPQAEQLILAELNRVRADPAAYADRLGRYRALFDGMVVRFPGNPVGLRTQEGTAAVDEAIAAMRRQAPLPAQGPSPIMARAAADHVAAQGPTGAIGHRAGDGSGPGDRVRRRGGGTYVAETISYGSDDAETVIRQLIVDDGVPSRGHRHILFDPRYRFAGIACGPHARYRMMCVLKFSTTIDGQYRATP